MTTEWNEYDSAAEWCARMGVDGGYGSALPSLLSAECLALISDDVEAFMRRVREFAYAQAMEATHAKHGDSSESEG